MTFKVGDRARFKQYYSSHWLKGDEVVITRLFESINNSVILASIKSVRDSCDPVRTGSCYTHRLEAIPVVDQIEDAKKVLEAAGFTVSPPKPKLTGWINIYAYPKNLSTAKPAWAGSYAKDKAEADQQKDEVQRVSDNKRIACVQFTEGDGLD